MSGVRLVEVSPRDGLQNEKGLVSTETKLELIDRLARAGLKSIEATAFVSPRWVPPMADHDAVMRALAPHRDTRYPVLVPNLRGYQAAVAAGAREVAVFASATESFSRRNINCSIQESFERFAPVFERARADGVAVRGYVSCVAGCPYEGAVPPARVVEVARRLHDGGCFEISLGDTIGVGTPATIRRVIEEVAGQVPLTRIAGHFHDTYGMATANVFASYELGVRTFDSSVGGLGGCPHAKGATGNVATEDLVYLFRGLGVHTGVNLNALVEIAQWISEALGRPIQSRVARALSAAHGLTKANSSP